MCPSLIPPLVHKNETGFAQSLIYTEGTGRVQTQWHHLLEFPCMLFCAGVFFFPIGRDCYSTNFWYPVWKQMQTGMEILNNPLTSFKMSQKGAQKRILLLCSWPWNEYLGPLKIHMLKSYPHVMVLGGEVLGRLSR